MKWSLYIGKVSGIKVFIHWTFLLLIIWITLMDLREGKNSSQIFFSISFIFSVFFCVILHELGHALVAKRFHYITQDITLLPIGGMARMDEIPETPKHELLVALSGPLVNLVIAAVLFPMVQWFGNFPEIFSAVSITKETFLYDLFFVNITLAIFNLIPAFPMDGGRVFRALMSFFIDRVKATTIAVTAGQVIAILFFFVGIFFNPVLAVIGIFIFLMAQSEKDYVKSKTILQNYKVKDVIMKKYFKLNMDDTIYDAVKLIMEEQANYFLIMKDNKVMGTINKNKILKVVDEKGINFPLINAMNKDITFLKPDMPLEKVYATMNMSENFVYPVVENHAVIGVVDINNVNDFITLKNADRNGTLQVYKKLQRGLTH